MTPVKVNLKFKINKEPLKQLGMNNSPYFPEQRNTKLNRLLSSEFCNFFDNGKVEFRCSAEEFWSQLS